MGGISRFSLLVHEEKCTGCRTCQYRCSWRFTRTINLARSAIVVYRTGNSVSSAISFGPECDSCGICARACPYGTLELMLRKEVAAHAS